ncbi:hypothetical protein HK405_010112 [Cladochytrium tenue]|nr:hypothetical protein HK405_010112 [Cladochytrium tenue]
MAPPTSPVASAAVPTTHAAPASDIPPAPAPSPSALNELTVTTDLLNELTVTNPADLGLASAPRVLEEGLESDAKIDIIATEEDNLVITWDGPDDVENPRNWNATLKWRTTIIVSLYTLVSPIASSMVAPALTSVAADINDFKVLDLDIIMTVFILAYAVGPFLLAPLSEIYGRVPVLQVSNAIFCVFNLLCGFAQNSGQLIAFRFLAGLGGSGPLVIGGGVLADVFHDTQRGLGMAIFTLVVVLGPCVGPIAAGFMAQTISWRWIFFVVSIFDVLVQIIGAVWLRESYGPVLLARRARQMRKQTGNPSLHAPGEGSASIASKMRTSVERPFVLLFTQPIVFVTAVYMMFIYGLMYLVIATFPDLWSNVYGEDVGLGGLNYVSIGLGFSLGTLVIAALVDRIFVSLAATRGKPAGTGRPEFRIPLMVPGSLLAPVGLAVYGWTAKAATHWAWPNLGILLWAAGLTINFQVMTIYVVDAYQLYAASALAATTFLRSLAGFGFPLFAESLYGQLGYGWGNTLLALIMVVIGIPFPFVFWAYGEKLRSRSKFAAN